MARQHCQHSAPDPAGHWSPHHTHTPCHPVSLQTTHQYRPHINSTAHTQPQTQPAIGRLTTRIHLAILCHYRPHISTDHTSTQLPTLSPRPSRPLVASPHAYTLPSCVTTDHTSTQTTHQHRPHISTDHTSTQTTHQHRPHISTDHTSTQTTHQYRPHINTDHTSTQTTHPYIPLDTKQVTLDTFFVANILA